MKKLVYEFWSGDIPTEIAKETLDELGVPYEVKVVKKLRVKSPRMYDYWTKIYIDLNKVSEWLAKRIEKEIL